MVKPPRSAVVSSMPHAARARRRCGRVWSAAAACMVAVLIVSVGHPTRGHAGADGEETSLTGEVLDAACYMAHGRKGAGPGHRKCADECINKKNFPIALLTEKDEVFLLLPDHADEAPYEKLKEHAAATVTVEGRRVTRGGLPALIVSGVEKK